MSLYRFFSPSMISRFYIHSLPSLVYGLPRGKLVASVWVCLEYAIYIMIVFDKELIIEISKIEEHIKLFQDEALLSRNETSSLTHVYVIFAVNIAIIVGLFGEYIVYYYYESKKKQTSSLILSICLSMYTPTISAPFMQLSFRSKSPIGYITAALVLFIGILHSMHQRNYSFEKPDYLAKRTGSQLGILRLLILFLSILLITWVEDSLIFPTFAIIISTAGIFEYLVVLPFIHENMNSLFLSLNCILLGVGIIVGIAQTISHKFSIILCIVVLVSISLKFGCVVHEFRCANIRNQVAILLNKKQLSQQDKFIELAADKIDYFVRYLSSPISVQYQNIKQNDGQGRYQAELSKNQIMASHLEVCQQRPYCQCDKINPWTNYALVSSLSEGELGQEKVIHQTVVEMFKHFLKNKKSMNTCHLSYIYYLLECSKNYVLVFTQSYQQIEDLKQQSLSLTELAHLKYVLSLSPQASSGGEDGLQGQSLCIIKVFEFDEMLVKATNLVLSCLEAKLCIFQEACKDVIPLKNLEHKINYFIELRIQLKETLKKCIKANAEHPTLVELIDLFKNSIGFGGISNLELKTKQSTQINDRLFIKAQRKRDQTLFSENSAAIFVSLANSSLGAIANVSQNFEKIFGFQKASVIGHNCNFLMPQSTSSVHDQVLGRYLSQGRGVIKRAPSANPLISINKQGFALPVHIRFELFSAVSGELGLLGLVSKEKDSESHNRDEFMIINMKREPLFIESCSVGIYSRFYSKSLHSEQYPRIPLSRFFPILPIVILKSPTSDEKILITTTDGPETQHVSTNTDVYLDTICFFPYHSMDCFGVIGGESVQSQLEVGNLSVDKNKIVLVKLKVWRFRDEFLDQATIRIMSQKIIDTKEFINSPYEALFLDQLHKHYALDYSPQQLRQFLHISKAKEDHLDLISEQQISLPKLIKETKQISKKSDDITNKTPISQMQIYQNNRISTVTVTTDTVTALLTQDSIRQSKRLMLVDPSKQKTNLVANPIEYTYTDNGIQLSQFTINSPRPTMKEQQLLETITIPQLSKAETQKLIEIGDAEEEDSTFQEKDNEQAYKKDQNKKIPSNKQIEKTTQKSSYFTHRQRTIQVDFDQESSDNQNSLEGKIAQKSRKTEADKQSTHLSSQSKSQKTTILNILISEESPKIFSLIHHISIFCLACLIGILIYSYFSLSSLFSLSQKNFSYIAWGNDLRICMTEALKDQSLQLLIQNPLFGSLSSTELTAYKAQLTASTVQSYVDFDTQAIKVIREQETSLPFLNYLQEKQTVVHLYYSSETNAISADTTTTVYHSILVISSYLYQYSVTFPTDLLAEWNLYSNFPLLANELGIIQQIQESSVSSSEDSITSAVITLLFLLTFIFTMFLLVIFPAFGFSQIFKQRILALFATFEPKLSLNIQKSLLRDAYYLSDDAGVKAASFKRFESSSLFLKKKSISASTVLPKLVLSLFIKAIAIYLLLAVYPLSNYFITKNLLQRQTDNQALQGALQTMKASFMSSFGMYTLFAKMQYFPGGVGPSYERYKKRATEVLVQADTAISNLFTIVSNQQDHSRFNQNEFSNFVFQILTINACQPIHDYSTLFPSQNWFNLSECNSLVEGVLRNGLELALESYLKIIKEIFEIHQISDQTQRELNISAFYNKYSLRDLDKLIEYIIKIESLLNTYISDNSTKFFQQMEDIQLIMLICELGILVLVTRFGILHFFQQIAKSMKEAKKALTIFEVDHIIENPYIMSYLRQHH